MDATTVGSGRNQVENGGFSVDQFGESVMYKGSCIVSSYNCFFAGRCGLWLWEGWKCESII